MNEQEARAIIERMDTRLRAACGEEDAAERAKLIQRVVELRSECRQIFIDAEYWNDNVRRPEEERIDPDPNGTLALLIEKLDAQVKAWTQ
jgi:hypothetical protein